MPTFSDDVRSPVILTFLPTDYYKPKPEHKIETERERENFVACGGHASVGVTI